MQDEISDKAETNHQPKRWYVRWWAWCLWVLLSLMLILMALGCWGWTQRYSLMENWVIDKLDESGFEADLEIMSVTRTDAHIKNIRLRRNGEDVLRVDDARAKYLWPDIRDGKIKRVELEGVNGQLNLNEDWQPDDWIAGVLPDESSTQTSGANSFPENGINLKDATLKLTSPLGETVLYIDADIPTAAAFSSEVTLAPSTLSYGGYAATGAGFVTLEKDGEDIRLIGQTQTETLSNQALEISKAHLQVDGTFNLKSHAYTGSVSLESDSFESDPFASGPIHLAWDGEIFPQDGLRATGTWTLKADKARSPRPDRAAQVAEKLSLAPALIKVPVTEHYVPQLQETVFEFLMGSDITGLGRLNYGPDGFEVNPVGDLKVSSPENQISLQSRPGDSFYVFDKNTGLITARMDAVFEKPVGLTLTDIQLLAASENGISLNGVKSFSARLNTQSDWQVTDATGRFTRLSPLKTKFQYDATQNPRRLSVDTTLDYDGNLPGGYVEGMTLDGRLNVRLYEGRQELDFTPKPDSFVSLKTLETPTDWKGENIRFTLPPTRNFFIRTHEQSLVSVKLNAADFILTRPATQATPDQRLDIGAAQMSLNGKVRPNKTQDWDIEFDNVNYTSETLPGPGTTGSGAAAQLSAHLAPGQAPEFTLNSPAINAETPQIKLSNIGVNLRGTPDAYTIDHKGGTISVASPEFAEIAKKAGLENFPASGMLKFTDETFSGRANLNIAKANDAEVNVDYTYSRGAGTMDVEIPSIVFDPKGLQPQALFPAARGKIARVNGEASAKLNIAFADNAVTSSGGTMQLIDLDVGTAPGPVTGLNTNMTFSSLFPLESSGQQTLTMESFNPGFPLEKGVVDFDFVADGVRVDAADWPIGNGSLSLDPFTWRYAADENRVTMRVKDVALGDFLNDLGNKKIDATGTVVGTFPVVIRGVDVLIEDGKISVPEGGLIKYDPGPNSRRYTEEEAIAILRQRRSNEYAALAQDALREFRYRELSASLDGPINGDVEIGLVFDGSNEKVLNRQPFRFDISVKGELFNIARSFNTNAHVKAEIMRQNGALPEGATIDK